MDKAVEQLFVEVEQSEDDTGTEGTATTPTGQHSTEPATVIWQGQHLQDISATSSLNADRAAGAGTVEPSSSFTLPEPSQVMKEHMQRRAEAEAHFKQGETVRSKRKRSQSRCPKNRQTRPYNQQEEEEQQRRQRELPNLEQEINRMIERTLNEHKVSANHIDELRNYLREETHRDQRINQLVRYQHEERLRMQQEFDRQQKRLIQEICAEMDLSVYSDNSSSSMED